MYEGIEGDGDNAGLAEEQKAKLEQLQAELLNITENGESQRLIELRDQQTRLENEREKIAIEAEKRIAQARIEELQRTQDEALDAVRLTESRRLEEIERLRLEEPRLAARLAADRLDITRATIEEELRLEQERLAFLEDQPSFTDPIEEAKRLDDIRAARQRLSDFTLRLIDNERQQQEASVNLVKEKIQLELQNANNARTAVTQGLEEELRLRQSINTLQQNQVALIQAQTNLEQALSSSLQSQFAALINLTEDEQEKADLAEEAAQLELEAVKRQVEVEQQLLDIQLKQNEAALEAERVQNRINQIRAEAAVAQSQAELATLQADPAATQQQIRAAELNVEAAQANQIGTQLEGQLLDERAQLQQEQGDLQRETLEVQGADRVMQAEINAASSLADEGERDRALEDIRRDIERSIDETQNRLDREVAAPEPTISTDLIDELERRLNTVSTQNLEASLQRQTPTPAQIEPTGIVDAIRNGLQGIGNFNVENVINNTFTGTDQTAVQDVSGQIRDALTQVIQGANEKLKRGQPAT